MPTSSVPAPVRLRRRVRLVVLTLLHLVRLEIPVRTRTLPRLCADAGIRFTGFERPDHASDETPLPRVVADAWWAADAALRIWPWARTRPCLRRALLLGQRVSDLDPALTLEIVGLRPLRAHAVLVVRGHRLDLGELESPADVVDEPAVDR